jgi:hypothetical protein
VLLFIWLYKFLKYILHRRIQFGEIGDASCSGAVQPQCCTRRSLLHIREADGWIGLLSLRLARGDTFMLIENDSNASKIRA